MRWKASVCRLGVLALLAVCASSSTAALDLPGVLTGYSIVSWSDEDGRPLGSVYAIAQDLEGYLWVGTDAGLVRFDGWRLARWETISAARLPSSPVSALFVSHDGILWVGFRDGAVRQIRQGKILPEVATESARTGRRSRGGQGSPDLGRCRQRASQVDR